MILCDFHVAWCERGGGIFNQLFFLHRTFDNPGFATTHWVSTGPVYKAHGCAKILYYVSLLYFLVFFFPRSIPARKRGVNFAFGYLARPSPSGIHVVQVARTS